MSVNCLVGALEAMLVGAVHMWAAEPCWRPLESHEYGGIVLK